MIDTAPFGRTGHASSRVIFGAAAFHSMSQPRADAVAELLVRHGVNHIDTAASYGDSELRLRPILARYPHAFFVASKTGERSRAGARDGIHRSLERLGVERLDMIQLHHLVDDDEWNQALGPGGALEAAVEAREEGLVRFIGVTGHGTRAPERHRASLERFAFDAVLFPYSFAMLSSAEYATDVARLLELCEARGVAAQTIKSIARRRWAPDAERRYAWYEPLTEPAPIERAVRFVLGQPGLFLNTSSDARQLPHILQAAERAAAAPSAAELEEDLRTWGIEPLFVRGVAEGVS